MTGKKKKLEPWERLPKETDPAWEAFRIYRDMGDKRSLQKTARRLHKSMAVIGRWNSRHGWRERVKAFSIHLDRMRLSAQEQAIQDHYAREVKLGNLMMDLSEKQLSRFKPEIRKRKDGTEELVFRRGKKVTPFDSRLLGVDGSKLVKSGLGLPETRNEVEITGNTFSDLARKAREKGSGSE